MPKPKKLVSLGFLHFSTRQARAAPCARETALNQRFPFRFGALPFDCTITVPYWSSAVELTEVLGLARQGNMRAHVQRFPLSQVTDVYQRLRQGGIDGQAVTTPQEP